MAEKKKVITVTQEVRELMFDVTNKAFLTGRAREAEKTKDYESASNMQASEDEEDSYQLRRSLANAFSSLKSLLGEYLDEDKTTTNNLIDKAIDDDGQLTLAFRLPSNYNNASADSLGKGIHAYLVDMVLSEWFTITNKNDAQDYVNHAASSLEIVKRALYKRSRPNRPSFTGGGA
ncbi:MAG: hypothetical protein NC212_08525 [Staphylococcus sp.]|nr:hypothetical protein [Staphylococcus sp.]